MQKADAIIIGGGLAGLSAAIGLAQRGHSVIVFEKHRYPRHKVCGEYLSREALPFLLSLGVDPGAAIPAISQLSVYGHDGRSATCSLPAGGVGVSRFYLDNLLYETALQNSCNIVFDEITNIVFKADTFTVQTRSGTQASGRLALAAYGRKSAIDNKLDRRFIKAKPKWIGIKAHYKAPIETDRVSLYLFPGGYCGVSAVEDGRTNICYLASYREFAHCKSPDAFTKEIVSLNPALRELLACATPEFAPLAISNISFCSKSRIENHMLMLGDSAQMIHPLSGNGMAMALGSAQMAIPLADAFLKGSLSREKMEKRYVHDWTRQFSGRIRAGRLISALMLKPEWSRRGLNILNRFPKLLRWIVSQTHGTAAPDFSRRSSLPEMMDDFAMQGEELRDALDKIASINRFLGGNRVTLQGVAFLARRHKGVLRIVDLGCGNGDMLRCLAKWARRNKIKAEFTGVDANAFTVGVAQQQSEGFPEIRYRCADIFEPDGLPQCEIALFTLTLHHFPDEVLVKTLSETMKKARLGIVVNDLHRSRTAFVLFKYICSIFKLNRMSREDGLVSILRGFTRKDLESYAQELKIINPKIRWKWAFRFQWIIKT